MARSGPRSLSQPLEPESKSLLFLVRVSTFALSGGEDVPPGGPASFGSSALSPPRPDNSKRVKAGRTPVSRRIWVREPPVSQGGQNENPGSTQAVDPRTSVLNVGLAKSPKKRCGGILKSLPCLKSGPGLKTCSRVRRHVRRRPPYVREKKVNNIRRHARTYVGKTLFFPHLSGRWRRPSPRSRGRGHIRSRPWSSGASRSRGRGRSPSRSCGPQAQFLKDAPHFGPRALAAFLVSPTGPIQAA